ncbi:putative NUDIX family NTP pyrophosphohydrolase [Arthrobacter sp. V4I6]|uniref:NUDIX domain-containing protein n=1 Tax=unclassified Arthrobacter TaxID=235627 RepID=UPI00278AA81D|nr:MULTISPECIES: NUDIX domain-containing protein [unclassified Arthrobacter]MDQ0821347.1 putative NUDIX family NTP pyrophosphohydrolase [Arthrobacter sp. V1I7]MDQ0855611.1 putative NUDIX family NTP pyrophosphohydrolase [Arthrobacter sp. V4I6]
MTVRSAGLLLYRRSATSGLEVWIAHMGGPFWAHKDAQAWSIPKGEYLQDEDPLMAALREFAEEIGTPAPVADYLQLGAFRQPSGKVITVFTAESDFAPERIVSNTFALEWPKGSGTITSFPEIDDAEWTREPVARTKLVRGQLPVLDALIRHLRDDGP